MTILLRSLLFAILTLSAPALAGEILTLRQDPAVSIQVPVPAGFASVPSTAEEFKDMQSQIDVVGNDLLGFFLLAPRTNTEEDFARQMNVQCNRASKGLSATKADLEAVRRTMDQQREKLAAQAQAKLGITGVVFDRVHDFSDRHFSMVLHASSPEGHQACGVVTAALVRGRLWYFSVRSEKSAPEDIKWATSTAKSWFASILTASPSDEETLAREEGTGGFLFKGKDRYATIGAIAGVIGVVVVLILINRKKPDQPV